MYKIVLREKSSYFWKHCDRLGTEAIEPAFTLERLNTRNIEIAHFISSAVPTAICRSSDYLLFRNLRAGFFIYLLTFFGRAAPDPLNDVQNHSVLPYRPERVFGHEQVQGKAAAA